MYEAIPCAWTLAVPDEAAGPTAFEQYLNRLLDWRQISRFDPTVRIRCSEHSVSLLSLLDAYPLRPHLQRAIERHGLVEYSANDIARVAESFLTASPYLEELINVSEILWSNITGCHSCASPIAAYQADIERICVLALLDKMQTQAERNAIILVDSDQATSIEVSATLHDLELMDASEATDLLLPVVLQGIIPLAGDLQSLLQSVDLFEVWSRAHDTTTLQMVLEISRTRLKQSSQNHQKSNNKVQFGSKFIETARPLGFITERVKFNRLLSAINGLLDGTNLTTTHSLRENSGGNSESIRRDSDYAVRMDLDHEFHLHLWKLAGGGYEFASIVHHNDFSIPR